MSMIIRGTLGRQATGPGYDVVLSALCTRLRYLVFVDDTYDTMNSKDTLVEI